MALLPEKTWWDLLGRSLQVSLTQGLGTPEPQEHGFKVGFDTVEAPVIQWRRCREPGADPSAVMYHLLGYPAGLLVGFSAGSAGAPQRWRFGSAAAGDCVLKADHFVVKVHPFDGSPAPRRRSPTCRPLLRHHSRPSISGRTSLCPGKTAAGAVYHRVSRLRLWGRSRCGGTSGTGRTRCSAATSCIEPRLALDFPPQVQYYFNHS